VVSVMRQNILGEDAGSVRKGGRKKMSKNAIQFHNQIDLADSVKQLCLHWSVEGTDALAYARSTRAGWAVGSWRACQS
jgi:hypothetical protein